MDGRETGAGLVGVWVAAESDESDDEPDVDEFEDDEVEEAEFDRCDGERECSRRGFMDRSRGALGSSMIVFGSAFGMALKYC